MFFKQLVKEDLGCASYIVGCTGAGVCAVIDPRLDMVDEILEITTSKGMRITAVIETHNHADHISGHHAIARRTGAKIYIHELANVAYPHQNLKDGDELRFGVAHLRVIHTPGHRPEHIALTVADTSRSADPWLVLTGDSLFIGDIARPDLAVPGEQGAIALYHSIFERLLQLEDGVEIYPAHVAGSLCGRGMNAKTSSTIGFERKHNSAASPRPLDQFVADMNRNLPQRPPNMANIVERNRSDDTHQPTTLAPHPFTTEAFQHEIATGALVLDIRSPQQFGAGHISGSLNIFLHGSAFATRAGFVASPQSRLLLVVGDEQDAQTAATQLAVVGFDKVVGYLAGGMTAWQETGLPTQSVDQLTVEALHSLSHNLTVLDVRDQNEWNEGHIAGAQHIPYYFIGQRIQELDPSHPTTVICGSGQRSSIASSILQRHGFTRLFNVEGGMEAWNEAGFETTALEEQQKKGGIL